MDQIGKVIKVDGKKAQVRVFRATACGGECGKCGGCFPTSMIIDATNDVNANVGQLVKLYSSTKNILLGAVLVYIMPVIALIVAYIVTYNYIISKEMNINAELISILVGIIVLAISFVIVKLIDKKISETDHLEMKIYSIIKD